jgi:hypothetical protein
LHPSIFQHLLDQFTGESQQVLQFVAVVAVVLGFLIKMYCHFSKCFSRAALRDKVARHDEKIGTSST